MFPIKFFVSCRLLSIGIAVFFCTLFNASVLAVEPTTSQQRGLSSEQAFTAEFDILSAESQLPVEGLSAEGYIALSWDIAPGYYLYKDKFRFKLKSGSEPVQTLAADSVMFPAGKIKEDKYFGLQEVYRDSATIHIPVTAAIAALQGDSFNLQVKYQGCADKGVCFPPKRKNYSFSLPELNISDVTLAKAVIAQNSMPTASSGEPEPEPERVLHTEENRLTSLLENGNIISIAFIFFLGGLALTFTPCVLPMIPILSSIIVGQKKTLSKREAFMLSLSYVMGMALTYASLGIVLGVAGTNITAYLQNPWVISVFAVLFVVLSLSMFGLYELRLPQSIHNKLNNLNNKQQGGTYVGTLVMGVLSALIVSPCVSAPLAGALVFISTEEGGALLGGSALFALALGMGTPLLIIGTGGTHLMPKSGVWMEGVKAFFGVMLLAVAIWFLERILPAPLILALWGALIMGVGVYLGGLEFDRKQGWAQFRKSLGFILVLYGVLLWLGAASGAANPLQPLSEFASAGSIQGQPSSAVDDINEQFSTVSNLSQLQSELQLAQQQGRPVLLDFYADWCVSCKVMDHDVFPEKNVRGKLEQFHLIRADVTDNTEMLEHYNLFGPPSLLFFDKDSQNLTDFSIRSEIHAAALAPHLGLVLQATDV